MKVGDEVICKKKIWVLFDNRTETNICLYKKIGRLKYIDSYNHYLIEFKEWIDGHDGDGLGKKRALSLDF